MLDSLGLGGAGEDKDSCVFIASPTRDKSWRNSSRINGLPIAGAFRSFVCLFSLVSVKNQLVLFVAEKHLRPAYNNL
jgi:hypothetical protein